jgi:hypothetical protein
VHLPRVFPLSQVKRRSCFPGSNNSYILTLGRDLSADRNLSQSYVVPSVLIEFGGAI